MTVSVFQITREGTGSSADVSIAQGRGHGGAPDDALEVVQPPGLRARPPVRGTTEALVIELPNGDRFAFVIDKGAKSGAVAVEAGETQLHGCAAPASVVRLRASGDIDVVAAPGRVVRLQGGTQPFVRGTDFATALNTFLAADQTFLAALAAVTAALTAYTAPTTGIQPIADPVGTLTSTLAAALTTFTAAVTARVQAATALSGEAPDYLSAKILGE